MAAEVLAEEVSPNGNILAVVEADEHSVHLVLHGSPDSDFGVRSCWVRNLAKAPASLDLAAMQDGRAPMLPAVACAHPGGAPRPRATDLRFVWLEAGDAVALLEEDELLTVIPAWSGRGGCSGYSRDCIQQSPLCWPMGPENAMHERVPRAEAYWKSWQTGDPWQELRTSTMQLYQRALGKPESEHAIDGKKWPPKTMLRFTKGDAVVLVTCGVSLRPQPKAELIEGPENRRIELGIAIERGLFERGPSKLMGTLSAHSNLPWEKMAWLGAGHTLPCDSIPMGDSGECFDAVLLLEDPLGAPAIELPELREDSVHLLWAVPITSAEREFAIQDGSKQLAARLRARGHGWIHRDRDPLI